MNGRLALAVALAALGVTASAALGAQEPATVGALPLPSIYQAAPGRFEVVAFEPVAGQRVGSLATEVWQSLTGPLGLPAGFSSPVFVRLIPAAGWDAGPVPFRVTAEAGGIVSVRIRWADEVPERYIRRALVQALLLRLAIAHHGVSAALAAPLWLEQAGATLSRLQSAPAQLDALKLAAARQSPPGLASLFDWQRGDDEPEAMVDGAFWLLLFLQSESSKAGGEWPALLIKLLAGEPPATALATVLPQRFASDRERELWWQTGWQAQRIARVLPTMEAADSRAEIAEQCRFVFVQQGRERVVPLREVLAHAREPEVTATLKQRVAALNRLTPSLHPFYRNAALSLVEALSIRDGKPEQREALCATFEQDWRDAGELEAASATALTALERKR